MQTDWFVVAENPQHLTRQPLEFVHHERRDIVARVQHQLHLQVAERVHRAAQVAQMVVRVRLRAAWSGIIVPCGD